MRTALVTGSSGLVGSTVTRKLIARDYRVVGIDNDMRGTLFGKASSVAEVGRELRSQFGGKFIHLGADIRNPELWCSLVDMVDPETIDLVVHAASQPSHDLASEMPVEDFDINARATLLILDWVRRKCTRKPLFVYMSTNKVYGDHINTYEFLEGPTRWLPECRFLQGGIDEDFPIDKSMHSLFGVSKAAGDLLTQEYGRYFSMKTVCLRCGCITGKAHRGAKQHGFLAYLADCVKRDKEYTILGYRGKQVRDNLHAEDVAGAILAMMDKNSHPVGEVFNMGGGPDNSISILEAIAKLEVLAGRQFLYAYNSMKRKGDHIWWVTNTRKFRRWYPDWHVTRSLDSILEELMG